MKARKPHDMVKVLSKKGFEPITSAHHDYYYLTIDGMVTDIYTYFSRGKDSTEYGKKLMGMIKKQLRFENARDMDNFFECTLTLEKYIANLREANEI
jgi:hypothetical protein